MKKSLIKTIIFLGFAVAVLGVIIDPIISIETAAYIISGTTISVAAILGATLIFSKNATVKNVGFALSAFVGAIGVYLIMETQLMITAVGLVIMLVGAILQFLFIVIKFLGFIKSEDKQISGDVSGILTKYKELEKEKIISEEEFNDLKTKAIAANADNHISLEDLKKWKKLLDQNIITDAEFSEMKSKLFTK